MGELKAERIANRALDLGIVSDQEIHGIWTELGSRNVPANDLLQLCVRRGVLTNYQVELLLKGDRRGFFFGDYKVLYYIGSGTFARVYRAVHKKTGKVVAVKVLRRRLSDSESHSSLFIREGELGQTLDHPNIVHVHEVYSQDRLHFLVMDFVEGWSLREFVKSRKRIDAVEATRLLVDVARGLTYAYEQGLAHRDVKMTNVLVSSRGQAKLTDFGLASPISHDYSAEMIAEMNILNTRTIDYAALERASGVRGDDTRSDIFFVGCMYYHMLSGESPLDEVEDKLARLSRARFSDITPIQKQCPDLAQSVALVVNRSMALDPDQRYQTPPLMLGDLEMVLKRLQGEHPPKEEEAAAGEDSAPSEPPAQDAATLLVVDSNAPMQKVLHQGLTSAGYRVVVTADPDLAVRRVTEKPATADAVVLNAQDLGEKALSAFNQLAEGAKTRSLGAVLLLEEGQHDWQTRARLGPRRIALAMPLKMKDLRESLAKILPAR